MREVWIQSHYVANDYPFSDSGENHTFFYDKWNDSKSICSCLAKLSDTEKKKIVSEKINLCPSKIVLKSKKIMLNK